jgi:hypothetical protein
MPPHVFVWEWYADTYGYTPDETEELPIEAQEWFPLIQDAKAEARERLQQEEIRQQQARKNTRGR